MQALLPKKLSHVWPIPQSVAVPPLWEPCVWQAQGTIFNLDFHPVPLNTAICCLVPSWLWYFWTLNLCGHCVGRRGLGTPSLALQAPWRWPLNWLLRFLFSEVWKVRAGRSVPCAPPPHLPRCHCQSSSFSVTTPILRDSPFLSFIKALRTAGDKEAWSVPLSNGSGRVAMSIGYNSRHSNTLPFYVDSVTLKIYPQLVPGSLEK